ncbi:hypothetical protein [Curvivirga aplysinae]|uniref:hypothetical protein n=1 Tax=Curvivirga aplysinae TaxID=2529852 RepID=UPI0012BCF46A|nr:hypothetical protein [Curvivirga aplysinae]MTI10564.1 hypothetical protein [Curvivirga aplysinae]
MDIAFTPQVNLPQTNTPQPQTGATAEAGAVSTLQRTPDNVVTAATETDQPNVRDEDASRRESRPDTPATLDTYQNLRIDGFQTRLGFDNETDTYFMEVLQPDSDNVIQRIPSESLIEYLDSKFDELIQEAPQSSASLDRSI